jgi:ribosomal protein S18 acetylase RimI-like enzyme
VQDCPDPFTWDNGLLMVAPQERGQGLGRQVQATLEPRVLQRGGSSLRRIVQVQNARELAFWRQLGFELEGTASQAIETETTTGYKMARHLTVPQEGTV